MSKDVTLTTPDTTLDELKGQFGAVSGLPVVKSQKDKTLVGVVSKKDLLKRGACVQDVRAAPGCVLHDDRGSVLLSRGSHRMMSPASLKPPVLTILTHPCMPPKDFPSFQMHFDISGAHVADHVDAPSGFAAGQQGR